MLLNPIYYILQQTQINSVGTVEALTSGVFSTVYFRIGYKNNTLDQVISVINNKSYSLRSLLALSSFSVDAKSNAKNKQQTAVQTPNGVFIVSMTIQYCLINT